MSPKVWSAWLCCMLALALPQLAAAAPPGYALTPVAGKFTAAVALNNAGQIAINNLGSDVPFRIGSIVDGNTSQSVGTLGGTESFIRGLNNNGEAVGVSQTAVGANHAFLYSGGRIRDLTVDHGIDSAIDLNDGGDIAGQVVERAALLRANGTVELFGPSPTQAVAINNSGAVAGDYVLAGQGTHAFLYAAGVFSDLGTLGGSFSTATGLNDAGAVVGSGLTAGGQQHAFLYDDGAMMDLAPAARSSMANGINNLGQVVGSMDARAFLYADGKMIDLNTLIARDTGFLLVSALAINDRQQILAAACDPTGTFCTSAVRLDPIPAIPEPRSAAMLPAGALLLAVMRTGGRMVRRRLSTHS